MWKLCRIWLLFSFILAICYSFFWFTEFSPSFPLNFLQAPLFIHESYFPACRNYREIFFFWCVKTEKRVKSIINLEARDVFAFLLFPSFLKNFPVSWVFTFVLKTLLNARDLWTNFRLFLSLLQFMAFPKCFFEDLFYRKKDYVMIKILNMLFTFLLRNPAIMITYENSV